MKNSLILFGVAIAILTGVVFFAIEDRIAKTRTADDNQDVPAAKPEYKEREDTYIVYYFHGARRCYTCNKIETDAKTIIRAAYEEEIENAKLSIVTLNVEEKDNAHFVNDFGLVSSSVVLTKTDENGDVEKFKVLSKTWNLVRDESAFKHYILSETQAFME